MSILPKRQKKPIKRYSPSLEMGLGFSQVAQRKKEGQTNWKVINTSKSYLQIVAENVFTFCNIVTFILVIMLFIIGEYSDTFSSLIIVCNIVVGTVQGIKAKNAVKRLSFKVDSDFPVIRDGRKVEVAARNIVLDDLVIIRAGSKVPVDGYIREGSVDLDESILTGESNIIKRGVGSYILSGSHVLVGEAVVQADRVGMDSNIHRIGRAARRLSKPKSKIFYALNYIIKIISVILIPLAIASFFVNLYVADSGVHNALKYTAASALAMLPVGMFFLTSCALAVAVLKLSQKNTLVQDLYGVEMLALVDTLLLDKTGTITTGEMRVVNKQVFSQEEDCDKILADLLAGTRDINSTAKALKKTFQNGSDEEISFALPFYSGRKYGGVTFKDGKNYLLGAPEFVSTFDGAVREFSEMNYKSGRRVVLLSRLEGDILFPNPQKCTPLMAVAIEDEIRDDAPCTLRWFKDNGVKIMVISGDDARTAAQIAGKAGIDDSDKYINCADLTEDELKHATDQYRIFGRVSPEQKCIIVNHLRKQGRTVGMVGDGVNDVHALKSSDCSISFGSANEVARSVAGIVLVDSKFSSLPAVVQEGRRVVSNIERVSSLYVMKNLFTIILTTICLCLGNLFPFSTSQMLMFEVFVLGFPALFLALQPNDEVPGGNFIQKVLKRTYPATFSLLFSVLASHFLFSEAFNIPSEMVSTVGALTLVACGFVQLIFNSLPLNKFRVKVIASCFVGLIAAIFLLYGLNKVGMTYISFEITGINGWGLLDIFLGIVICVILNILFHFILGKIRNDEKKAIPFYLESYYRDAVEEDEEEEGYEEE